MENMFRFQSQWGEEQSILFKKGTYANNGNLYVGAYSFDKDGELNPYCNITVNFKEKLETRMAYVDTNNCDVELLKAMMNEDYMTYMSKHITSGFCTYPMFCFSEEFLNSIEELK